MLRKALPLLLAAVPAGACFGQDFRAAEPSVLYYVSVPLGGASRAEREPVAGFALQGRPATPPIRVDSRFMRLIGGGVEIKWLIVGGVAAGAVALAASRDATAEAQRAAQASQPTCPARPAC